MTSDPMAIAAAAVVIIGAFATGVVTVINALGNAKSVLLKATEAVGVRTEEVHMLVNGNATKAEEKLTALEGQLTSMRTELSRIQEQRVEDAKTKAATRA